MFSRESIAKCSLPVFMLKNDEEASYCGQKRALISCIITTIIIVILTIIAVIVLTNYYKTKLERDAAREENELNKGKLEERARNTFIWWPILVGSILITLVWLFGPKLFIEAFMVQYTSKKFEREAMKRSGLSEKESFQQQQKLFESKQQADSRLQAARIQANAMSNQTDTLKQAIRNKFRYRY